MQREAPKMHIGFEIRTLNNLLSRKMIASAAKNGVDELTIMHGWIIGYLCRNQDRDIFQRDIETEFSISRSTVTGILKLMEKKGYIVRESVPRDARLKKLVLTELGKEMDERARSSIDALEEEMLGYFSAKEIDGFFAFAAKLRSSLEEKE